MKRNFGEYTFTNKKILILIEKQILPTSIYVVSDQTLTTAAHAPGVLENMFANTHDGTIPV